MPTCLGGGKGGAMGLQPTCFNSATYDLMFYP